MTNGSDAALPVEAHPPADELPKNNGPVDHFNTKTSDEEISRSSPLSSGAAATTFGICQLLITRVGRHLDYFQKGRAYREFLRGYRKGFYLNIPTFVRLIDALGHAGEVEKVHLVYGVAQHVIIMTHAIPVGGSEGQWHQIEDKMIIALVNAGDVEGANNHRLRIIEYDGAPSADAYAALIDCVEVDTGINAYPLFRESQMRGVVPNKNLYDAVISRLAKAGEANLATELLGKMKRNGFQPSIATYGTIIGVCSRLGDDESADAFFGEMLREPGFKPDVSLFHTMMELYTYLRPKQEKAILYHCLMVSLGILPNIHTYKIMIDAHGTISPFNPMAMEQAFGELCADKSLQVGSTHWKSLIEAYGCVQKDLDSAIKTFESIASHPSTPKDSNMPDYHSYGALIGGMPMTAYMGSCLIRGYGIAGDLRKARDVFESLVALPTSSVIPNNQTPHQNASMHCNPVIWEAMVCLELCHRNRCEAITLLRRVQAMEKYPFVVSSRIYKVIIEHLCWSECCRQEFLSWDF